MDVRDRYEAQALERRRLALALRRGTQHSSLLREAHPNRLVAAGLGVALLAVVGAGVSGLASPRAPKGWDTPGNVVLDGGTGQRFVVAPDRVLRPVLSETSLRLVFPGGAPAPVTVKSRVLRDARRGAPVGRSDVPFEPPALLGPDAVQQRCQTKTLTALLAGGAAAAGGPQAVLVRTKRGGTVLLAGGRALRVADSLALSRLGYRPDQAIPTDDLLLGTVPSGPVLAAPRIAVATGAAAKSPPLRRQGALLTAAPSGRSFVVDRGRLRPLRDRTAVQLVFGPSPPGALPVPDAAVGTAPRGAPVLAAGAPADPPTPAVRRPDGALCVDGKGAARVLPRLPSKGLGPAPVAGQERAVLLPAGQGLLLANSAEAVKSPGQQAPVLLLVDGRAFPVTSGQVIMGLGYRLDQVAVVPRALTALARRAPLLEQIELG